MNTQSLKPSVDRMDCSIIVHLQQSNSMLFGAVLFMYSHNYNTKWAEDSSDMN